MPDRIEELAEDYITFPGGRQIRTQEKLTRDMYNKVASPLRRGGNRIEELFAELAESAGGQQQFQLDQQLKQMEAERDWINSPEGKQAAAIAGGLSLLALTRGRLGGKDLPPTFLNKLYGQVGQDFRKYIIPPLSDVGRRLTGRSGAGVGTDVVGRSGARVNTERSGLGRLIFGPLTQTGRSGSRVGTDVAGRYALPKTKPSVVTKQGPRGPINIDSPKQLPLKGLEDARYTKGLSETDREMIKRLLIPPLTKTGQTLTKGSLTAADKIRAQIAQRKEWLKSAKNNFKKSDDAFQEGSRSGYQPDITAGSKGIEKFGNRIAQLEKEIADLLKLLE